MSCARAIAVCLLVWSACAEAGQPASPPGTICSIQEVQDKLDKLAEKPDKAGEREIMRQCNWAVDASSCTFQVVIDMFKQKKTRDEVKSKCMR
jgi:hypothetical protein